MSAGQNREGRTESGTPLWVFGYGSLIYKVDFPFLERRAAKIRGWRRRFWQGSHDHRGTPDAPGRVVTLIPHEGAECQGMAYLVAPEVFDHLDVREKNGYLRFTTDLIFQDGQSAAGWVYVASRENHAFLGPATEREIARHIATSAGPSGSNRDYLLRLAQALRELGDDDAHVFAVERHLRELEEADG